MDQPFPCNQCGLCCRNLQGIEALQEYDLGNGTCKYLIDNKCSIYEDRPEICQVDTMFEKYFYKHMNWDQYVLENIKVCQQLQKDNGVPEGQQIKLIELQE